MGIGVVCDVSIKDAWVSSDALMDRWARL